MTEREALRMRGAEPKPGQEYESIYEAIGTFTEHQKTSPLVELLDKKDRDPKTFVDFSHLEKARGK